MAGLISYLMKKTNEDLLPIKSIIKTTINYAYAFTPTQNREFLIKLLGLDFKGGGGGKFPKRDRKLNPI